MTPDPRIVLPLGDNRRAELVAVDDKIIVLFNRFVGGFWGTTQTLRLPRESARALGEALVRISETWTVLDESEEEP